MLWLLLIIPVGLYVGLAFLIWATQTGMVYHPEKKIEATPESLGLEYEEEWIETADKVRINAWFVKADNPRGTLLFCHGNAGNISHRLESIYIFNRLGLNVLIFDYRGFGMSQGKPDETGTYNDAEAAWNHLVSNRGMKPKDIIILGQSLGGAVAAWLAQDRAARALVLESTFTSVPDVASGMFPFLPIKWISKFQYNAGEYVKRAKCPVLVIHSPEDEVIPFRFGRKLFDEAIEPKEFLKIRGGHNNGFFVSGETYIKGLADFIAKTE